MSTLFRCIQCERSQEVPPPNSARRACWRLAGFAVPDDDQRICADCLAWMLDVERICRRKVQQQGVDPDGLLGTRTDAVPLWTLYLDDGRWETSLPSPEQLKAEVSRQRAKQQA